MNLQAQAAYQPDIHRLLPQAPDAEQGLLSSLLLSPRDVFALCNDRGVTPDWFHIPAHMQVYHFLSGMIAAGMSIDFITLAQAMRDQNELEQIGGAPFITQLFTFVPTAANAGYYIGIVAEKYALREVIRTCTQFAARAYDEQDNPGDLIDELQGATLAINRPDADAAQDHIEHIKRGVLDAITGIEETYHARGGVVGLASGFHRIDRRTGGFRPGQLIIIAGRPSMGKSALIWNIAEHVAIEEGKEVLGFSLEMTITELAARMVCGRSKVNLQRVRDGYLSKDQLDRTLPAAANAVAGAPIWIDETAGISIQELRVRVRRHLRRHPQCCAIFIDYLQLMCSNSRRAKENRALEIGEISGGLKKLAREIQLPIIAGAQLNRDNDGPKSKPKLSNLRESGTIEQDADVAMLLHRAHYYTKDEEDEGKANIDLAKQRNGPTGDIELLFNAELARFENHPGEALYSNDPERREHHTQEEM